MLPSMWWGMHHAAHPAADRLRSEPQTCSALWKPGAPSTDSSLHPVHCFRPFLFRMAPRGSPASAPAGTDSKAHRNGMQG